MNQRHLRRYLMIVFSCLMLALLVLPDAQSQAYTLSLETTTNGATQSSSFTRGQDIYLNVKVDSTTGIAGSAFTIEYNDALVTPPGISAEGLSDGITSTLFTLFTDSRTPPGDPATAIPMRAGPVTGAAKIALSGANIDTTTGGAKTNLGILFTLKFTVKNDAAIGGTPQFILHQTVLNNTAAGYPAEGAAIPLLVGAVASNHDDWGDLTKAFPVLLPTLQTPIIVNYSIVEVQKYAVSGTIEYAGYQSGTLKIGLYSDASLNNLVASQEIAWPQGTSSKAFSIDAANGTYYVAAYIDTTGVLAEKANGKRVDAVVINGAPDTSTRISLTDPLSNGPGSEPLYYVNWKNTTGQSWSNIGGMLDDADKDGYSNIQEYLNQKAGMTGFSPTVKDEAGQRGYNPATDEVAAYGVRTHGSGYVPGSNFEVTIRITYSGSISALGVEDTIPQGWTYVSVAGTNPPTVTPQVDATGILGFGWLAPPSSPVEFKYTVKVPSAADGTKTFSGEVLYRREAGELRSTITDTTVQKKSYHSADYNPANWKISLSELLRVVQFFNLGGYHCDSQGEDGYAPQAGDQTCTPHNSDYNTQNWKISLSELLRLVQFFNLGGYHVDPTGEDGYAPGLQ